jgi:DNA-binding response OmpR family regulator
VSVLLLVDDEPQMETLVGMCLRDLDARVVWAGTSSEARVAAHAERPSVVLLDIGLGSEDGLDLLDEFQEDPALSDVPVVVFSIHDSRMLEALTRGADGFVSKPFRLAGLRAVLQERLR